jgi:hypothetical protein
VAVIALTAALVIDISIVKVYDLVDKSLIPEQLKLVIFSLNTSIILVLEFIIIRYLGATLKRNPVFKRLDLYLYYKVLLGSLCVLTFLITVIIFQQFFYGYYTTSFQSHIISISYGTAAFFVISLCLLFISWYKSTHNVIVFLYFISMLLIAFNLVATPIITYVKLVDRPGNIPSNIGGQVDLSAGRYSFLNNIFTVSSILSFISIWVTTAVLMNKYREKLVSSIVYWIILSLPLVYFFVNYFYQFIVANILISYLTIDPITFTIILTAFLSLSKPIGGLVFAIAFWKIAKVISYEKNIRTYISISGWGIFFIFAANQAATQIVSPYPPFGLATTTVLVLAGFLMLLGIYNSAILVSTNDKLREVIHKKAVESRLLGSIGRAELEREMQKTIGKIEQENKLLEDKDHPVELDVKELKKYIELVTKEVKEQEKI